jgi:hypothetical protein
MSDNSKKLEDGVDGHDFSKTKTDTENVKVDDVTAALMKDAEPMYLTDLWVSRPGTLIAV